MNNYTVYCTERQAKKSIELGAPLIKLDTRDKMLIYGSNKCFPIIADYPYAIPTADQMINWLEEQEDIVSIEIIFLKDLKWSWMLCAKDNYDYQYQFNSRKEATLAAIDKALDYLSNNK